jgi:hypothetical protein
MVVGCASTPLAVDNATTPERPQFVDVTLINTMIGPAKQSGKPWDGWTPVDPEKLAQVAEALDATDPYVAVAALFAGPVLEGITPPEPKGSAQFLGVAAPLDEPRALMSQQDTLTPDWDEKPTWQHVPLSPDVRLRVSLLDYDVSNDDPIGTFELNENDFAGAFDAGQVFQVNVSRQTYNQVLFVGISVRRSVTERHHAAPASDGETAVSRR